MSKTLIFTATYNEKDNIKILIEKIKDINIIKVQQLSMYFDFI